MRDKPKLPAQMRVWRIYGIRDDYVSSRQPGTGDWVTVVSDAPRPGDETKVRLGELPPDFVTAVRYGRASLPAMAGIGDWRRADNRLAARDQAIRDRADKVDLSDIIKDYRTFVAIEVRRPATLTDATGSEFLWADLVEALSLRDDFRAETVDYFSLLTAFVLSGLRPVVLDGSIARSDRVYFFAEGKGPFAVPDFTANPVSVSIGRLWTDLPFDDLADAVRDSAQMRSQDSRLITSPGKWLMAALREKDDPLRQFLFAFFGLEVLAAKFASRYADPVIDDLKRKAGGLPIEELVWPKQKDDDHPVRNLVFRFTLMAIALTPDTAASDVDTFRGMAKARNSFAHGDDLATSDLPSRECSELLARYLGLIPRYLGGDQ